MPPSSVATKVEKDAAGKILVVIRELHICAAIQPHERRCSPERKEVSDGGRSVQVEVGLGVDDTKSDGRLIHCPVILTIANNPPPTTRPSSFKLDYAINKCIGLAYKTYALYMHTKYNSGSRGVMYRVSLTPSHNSPPCHRNPNHCPQHS